MSKLVKSPAVLSPLAKSLLEGLQGSGISVTPSNAKRGHFVATFGEETIESPPAIPDGPGAGLMKSIAQAISYQNKTDVSRLAFESDPSIKNEYLSLFKSKTHLIPDTILKGLMKMDDLVAAILNLRGNQTSSFGRPQFKRSEKGFKFLVRKGILERCTPEQKIALQTGCEKLTTLFRTCGSTDGWESHEQLNFSDYLYMSTRYALGVGRMATELIYTSTMSGERKFHSFRVIDAGTVYRASRQKAAGDSVRKQARLLLEQVKGQKLEPERYLNDEYAWVQVVNGRPLMAFTGYECVVQNFYPNSDVELDGYPITPIDTAISAITTHLNITTHNKLYFQNGRAARGMVVVKSNDVDDPMLQRIRQQFQASINSVNSSHRMPIFGVDPADEISWVPLDSGSRDMEFSYMVDQNARVIMTAFQVSPDELPGWAYLSRGSSNQSLSQSNNDYNITSARDLGLRPLLDRIEDHINNGLLPVVDPELAPFIEFKFVGLDADTEEKESIRLQQDAALHMGMNDIMKKVEKPTFMKEMGGEYPFNPAYQQILNKFVKVGQQKELILGVEGASQDPELNYYADAMWFQFMAIKMQMEEHALNMQMATQQQANPQPLPDADPSTPPPGEGDGNDQNADNVNNEAKQGLAEAPQADDLNRSLDEAINTLSKSDTYRTSGQTRLALQHARVVDKNVDQFEQDMEDVIQEILNQANKSLPKK